MNTLQHIDAGRSHTVLRAHYLSLLTLTPLKPVSSMLAVQHHTTNNLQPFVRYESYPYSPETCILEVGRTRLV
jgi:hypothetical protein